MTWIQLIPIAAVCSIPITFLILEIVARLKGAK